MSDPYWSNVTLAMHMDGVNNSTTFTDLKGHSVTPYGNAKISTTQSKFGGASAYFDGSGDYLSIPHSSDYNLSSGDFTIECWINVSDSKYSAIICKSGNQGVNFPAYALMIGSSVATFVIADSTSGLVNTSDYISSSAIINNGVFTHIAITKQSNIYKMFINGVQNTSMTSAKPIVDKGDPLLIAKYGNTTTQNFNGYIDDLRITKGIARYTSSFTPPTQAFPDSGGATNTSSMFLVF